MSFPLALKRITAILGMTLLIAVGSYLYAISPHHTWAPAESADGLLDRADTLAWGNLWVPAAPLYAKAERLFVAEKRPAKALYAEVSQIPPDESGSVPAKILQLTRDLAQPAA